MGSSTEGPEPSVPNHYLQMLNLFPLNNCSDVLLPCSCHYVIIIPNSLSLSLLGYNCITQHHVLQNSFHSCYMWRQQLTVLTDHSLLGCPPQPSGFQPMTWHRSGHKYLCANTFFLLNYFPRTYSPKWDNLVLSSFLSTLVEDYQTALQNASLHGAGSLSLHDIISQCIFGECEGLTLFAGFLALACVRFLLGAAPARLVFGTKYISRSLFLLEAQLLLSPILHSFLLLTGLLSFFITLCRANVCNFYVIESVCLNLTISRIPSMNKQWPPQKRGFFPPLWMPCPFPLDLPKIPLVLMNIPSSTIPTLNSLC